MSQLLHIGLFTEGSTDIRFLESVVKRTFVEVAFDCPGEVDIEVSLIKIDKKDLGFVDQVLRAAQKGLEEFGIMLLCVHVDADDKEDKTIWEHKIRPALCKLEEKQEEECCKYLLPVVPVYMTEAWMLADKELLKEEIGTNKSDSDLNIHREPEKISDPKAAICEAIRIARQEVTKRRRRDLSISELYLPIGQQIDLNKLSLLPSYQKFRGKVVRAFKELNFMH